VNTVHEVLEVGPAENDFGAYLGWDLQNALTVHKKRFCIIRKSDL